MTDLRRWAPATERNRVPILDILSAELPATGRVLEIASGTGEHVTYFAHALPHLVWQPSDPSAEACASIAAWIAHEGLENVPTPIELDASCPDWPVGEVDAILCINMVHISPWAATEGLVRGAGQRLKPGGLLYIYGPFMQDGVPTAASNLAFDADLRRRNAQWGLRRVEDVAVLASDHGLVLRNIIMMPANNLSLLLRKTIAT